VPKVVPISMMQKARSFSDLRHARIGYARVSTDIGARRLFGLAEDPAVAIRINVVLTPMLNEGMRSTNPIWQLAPVFGQLDSWNENTKLVVGDNGAAGKKSSAWSMNSKQAVRTGRSSVEAAI